MDKHAENISMTNCRLDIIQDLYTDFHWPSDRSFEKFDAGLPGYTNSRQVIKWLYEDQTRVGDVKRFTLNEGYLVAKADSFNKKSLPIIDEVRDEISDILLNEKKYDFFKDKHKSNIEIESLSTDYDIELERASAVTQYDPILVGAGSEPYIIGSAFALNIDETSSWKNEEKSKSISGPQEMRKEIRTFILTFRSFV